MDFKKITTAIIVMILMILIAFPAINIYAEGETVTLSLNVSSSTVNIGKTFNVTLMANPNMTVDIQAFDARIKFDSSKLDLTMDGNNPKITRPSGVPSSYLMGATVTGDEIDILCEDPNLTTPIKAQGNTALITFTFSVKDSAQAGSTASISILSGSVTTIYMQIPDAAYTEISSPRNVTIGPRLDVNNFLSSLSVEGYELSPAFARDVYDYRITVPEDVTSIVVNTQREVSTSSVSISGAGSLNYGDNMVTVTVTAQDPDRTRRYRITVSREFPPEESSLETDSSEISEPDVSSESPLEVTPTVEITPEPSSSEDESFSKPPEKHENNENLWKTMALISTVLFFICAGVMIWLIIDKVSNKDKVVRIRRK